MRCTRRELLGAGAAVAAPGCLRGHAGRYARACPATVGDGGVDARLGFVGDVMFGRGVNERWGDGPPEGVWGSTLDRLRALDGLFVNLECCLSDRGRRQPDRAFYFRADPDWAVPALSAGNVRWAGLANNHVLDYGPVAFADTRQALSEAGIDRAGAGPDLDTALQPPVLSIGDLSVAVVAFTDRAPAYAAGPDRPGTAFVRPDPERSRTRRLVDRALVRARGTEPDLVIASLHWGRNWQTEPTRTHRQFARWLIDRGVDVVHGHSAHVIQGVEVYRGRPIVHDAGDFVDDYAVKPGLHNDRSFLFELVVADGRLDALRLVPVEIDDSQVTFAGEAAARWLRDRMRRLSGAFETTVLRDGDGLRIPLATACR